MVVNQSPGGGGCGRPLTLPKAIAAQPAMTLALWMLMGLVAIPTATVLEAWSSPSALRTGADNTVVIAEKR